MLFSLIVPRFVANETITDTEHCSSIPATGSLSVPTWLTCEDVSVACAPTLGHVISDWKKV